MSNTRKLTLSDLALMKARGGQVTLPPSASLPELARLLAADAFGQPDSGKEALILTLLQSDLIKPFHVVVGQTKWSTTLSTFMVRARPPSFSLPGERARGRAKTLDEEVRERRPEQRRQLESKPVELVNIVGLSLDDLLRFKQQFTDQGMWGPLAKVLLDATDTASQVRIEVDERRSTIHNANDRKAKDLCTAAGLELDQVCSKGQISCDLIPAAEYQGYKEDDLRRLMSNLDGHKGIERPGRDRYRVISVCRYIIDNYSPQPTIRQSMNIHLHTVNRRLS